MREHILRIGNIQKTSVLLAFMLFLFPLPLIAQDEGDVGGDEGEGGIEGDVPTHTYTPKRITSNPDVILTQHWAMPTLLNPAATGNIDFIRARGAARLQELGRYHAPKNFLAAVDAPFLLQGKRIGAGIIVNSQNYDLYRNLQIGAQGSYKFQIKKGTLSVGIQLGYYHSKYRGSEYIINNSGNPGDDGTGDLPGDITGDSGELPGGEVGDDSGGDLIPDVDDDPTDDDMFTQDIAGGAFDVAIGIRYEHPKFHVGLSVQHLTNSKVKLSTEGESNTDTRYLESKLPMTLYFDAGGNIPIHNSLISLQPSLVVASDFSDIYGVAEMRATYNQLVTFGVNYRYNQAVGVLAGISIKNFFLGYNWEYNYTKQAKGTTGNHEIVLGYQFKLDMGGKNLFSHRSIRIM